MVFLNKLYAGTFAMLAGFLNSGLIIQLRTVKLCWFRFEQLTLIFVKKRKNDIKVIRIESDYATVYSLLTTVFAM